MCSFYLLFTVGLGLPSTSESRFGREGPATGSGQDQDEIKIKIGRINSEIVGQGKILDSQQTSEGWGDRCE